MEQLHDPTKDLAAAAQQGLTIADYRKALPIFKHRLDLLYLVEEHQVVVLVGQTGCGKTTQIPQYLYEAGWSSSEKAIACTQPRRVAATSVAERVAEEMGTMVGQVVGYSIRHDDKTTPGNTQIKYMTDGTLFRELLFDPLLNRYSVIIVDEAHERSLYTDLLLAALKKIIQKRPDLRIIISSATIDADRFVDFFKNTGRTAKTISGPTLPPGLSRKKEESKGPALIHLEGSTFPIGISYAMEPIGSNYVEAVVDCIIKIDQDKQPGDILVFLTGRRDIEEAAQLLSEQKSKFHVLPLHASLPTAKQMEVFKPAPRGRRKIILATNLAETSLTIDDIVFVIDCGLVKRKVFDPKLGISQMKLCRISKSSARQRAGRAGRTRPGKVFRLYTKAEHDDMADFSPAEIQLTDITSTLLQLMALGIRDFSKFQMLDMPPTDNMTHALKTLHALEAIDDNGFLTPDVGRIMSEISVEPTLAKMLITSQQYRCTCEMIKIVAMMSVGDIFYSDVSDEVRRKQSVEEGDLISYLNSTPPFSSNQFINFVVLNSFKENEGNSVKWCQRHCLNLANLQKADRFSRTLSGHLKHFGLDPMVSCGKDVQSILKCILSGQFLNLAQAQHDGTYRLVRSPEVVLSIHPDSVLFKRVPEWVVFDEAVQTTKLFIRNVSIVEKKWAAEVVPHYFKAGYR